MGKASEYQKVMTPNKRDDCALEGNNPVERALPLAQAPPQHRTHHVVRKEQLDHRRAYVDAADHL